MSLASTQPKGVPQHRRTHWEKTWASQASVNAYADLGTYWDKVGFEKATMQIRNTGVANSIDYKILGSLDGTNYDIEIISLTTILLSDYDLIDISDFSEGAYIPYIKIQIKSTVGGAHSTVTAVGVCI